MNLLLEHYDNALPIQLHSKNGWIEVELTDHWLSLSNPKRDSKGELIERHREKEKKKGKKPWCWSGEVVGVRGLAGLLSQPVPPDSCKRAFHTQRRLLQLWYGVEDGRVEKEKRKKKKEKRKRGQTFSIALSKGFTVVDFKASLCSNRDTAVLTGEKRKKEEDDDDEKVEKRKGQKGKISFFWFKNKKGIRG
jgi:hypothetical protein